MSRAAAVQAPAKVNLFLRVLGRRPDGYHDVETLLQGIELCDDVSVELGGEGIELTVSGPEPCPPRQNLAWLAAERFAAVTGLGEGVRIRLTKRIPTGAGLGGGSSDAGAVLRALSHLSGMDEAGAEVMRVAGGLGADVPFFLCGSPLALATGRGDALEALAPLPEAHMVLALPPVHVSTAAAYVALDRTRADVAEGRAPVGGGPVRGGPEGAAPAGAAPAGKAYGGQAGSARGGSAPPRPGTWEEASARMHNDFEAVVAPSKPEIGRSLQALRDGGASSALLCGSGGASFGLYPDRRAAEAAVEALSALLGWPCRAVRTLVEVPRPT